MDQVWQVYGLTFFLQAASAGFTPAFQAVIPDVLNDEDQYTNALSLLRLAEDMEELASPIIAALLLTAVSFPVLFAGTVMGFVASALLVLIARLANGVCNAGGHFWADVPKGIRIYTHTPRLRGLMVMEAAVVAAGAMVYVNTVVLVHHWLGLGATAVALAIAGFGAGSMLAAVLLPRILGWLPDRRVMIGGAALMVAGVALVAGLTPLILLWALIGFGFALTQTPIGWLINRSAHPSDRGAVFAAQFVLSHACWLVNYTLAGWIGAGAGLSVAALTPALIGGAGLAAALHLCPPLTLWRLPTITPICLPIIGIWPGRGRIITPWSLMTCIAAGQKWPDPRVGQSAGRMCSGCLRRGPVECGIPTIWLGPLPRSASIGQSGRLSPQQALARCCSVACIACISAILRSSPSIWSCASRLTSALWRDLSRQSASSS